MTVELLAVAKTLSKPINDLYELGKDQFKSQLQKAKSSANINKIHKQISNVHKVKTIWQIDKAVSLKKFYYPSSLVIDSKKTNINSISKIQSEENIVIQGIVGQGKSIFLRYLSYQEINIGSRLPIFFELRKIEKNETLALHISKILDSYGFDTSPSITDFLLSSGKIVLILDGFDEITHEKVKSIITELELLSEKYQNLKIVVSSRPDSGIEKSPYFRVFNLAPLTEAELPQVLKKITDNKDQIESITNAIKTSETNIRQLLTTPLMVTLLVLIYKSEQKIPEQLSEFYENLFSLLLSRHDKSKPGYTRERFTHLSERKLQQVFEAFCFITRKNSLSSLSNDDMHESAEEALSIMQASCDSCSFIKDITKVSNLILEEGYKYYFIHKSVQEFHAANYIKSRPEEAAIGFYSKVIQQHHEWWQEINFLRQIDTYRYTKYLLIPSITNFFLEYSIETSRWIPLTKSQMDSMLRKLFYYVPLEGEVEISDIMYGHGELGSGYYINSFASTLQKALNRLNGNDYFHGDDKCSLEMIALAREIGTPDDTSYDGRTEVKIDNYEYYKHNNLLEKCYEIIEDQLRELHTYAQEKIKYTLHEENSLSI